MTKADNMSNPPSVQTPKAGSSLRMLVGIATVLCIVCCTLILLIPTESINMDPVYQGF
jgi:hypothetical protein